MTNVAGIRTYIMTVRSGAGSSSVEVIIIIQVWLFPDCAFKNAWEPFWISAGITKLSRPLITSQTVLTALQKTPHPGQLWCLTIPARWSSHSTSKGMRRDGRIISCFWIGLRHKLSYGWRTGDVWRVKIHSSQEVKLKMKLTEKFPTRERKWEALRGSDRCRGSQARETKKMIPSHLYPLPPCTSPLPVLLHPGSWGFPCGSCTGAAPWSHPHPYFLYPQVNLQRSSHFLTL